VIVAHRLVTTSADYRALVPLVDGMHAHLGRKPREVSCGVQREGFTSPRRQRPAIGQADHAGVALPG
jgi:hypothetical protein